MWPEMRTSGQHWPEAATHSLLLMFLFLSREHQHLSRLLQEGRRQEGRQGAEMGQEEDGSFLGIHCLLYTSPSPRDLSTSRMPSSA